MPDGSKCPLRFVALTVKYLVTNEVAWRRVNNTVE